MLGYFHFGFSCLKKYNLLFGFVMNFVTSAAGFFHFFLTCMAVCYSRAYKFNFCNKNIPLFSVFQKKLKANYFSSEKEGFSLGKADPVTPMIQSSCINITHKEKGERLENEEKDSVISGDTILQKEVAKSSSVYCKEVGKCFEFASDVATTKHQPDDGAVCQTSGKSSVACGTSTALVDSGSLRSTINRLSQGQSDRRCHISGVNSRRNIDLANCNPNNLPQGLIRSEPVTFEEARDGLMTALAYLETNHILPGTTFKFLKRHR